MNVIKLQILNNAGKKDKGLFDFQEQTESRENNAAQRLTTARVYFCLYLNSTLDQVGLQIKIIV